MTQAPKHQSQWRNPAMVPREFIASEFVLRPLHERHAEIDRAAFLSCRERLNTELQWNGWPPADMTLQANRQDLAEHYAEFQSGAAFAFTVLSVDESKCLGCIYIERTHDERVAQFAFWMVDEALNVEETLVKTVLKWLHNRWSFQRVLIPLQPANQRGIQIAERLNLVEDSDAGGEALKGHCCFVSQMQAEHTMNGG